MKIALLIWFALGVVLNLTTAGSKEVSDIQGVDRRRHAAFSAVLNIVWLYCVLLLL